MPMSDSAFHLLITWLRFDSFVNKPSLKQGPERRNSQSAELDHDGT